MQRFIPFEGCVNFRDLGGYPAADGRKVRWGKLFRSDALQDLTPSDVAKAVDQLGIATVVDLRNSDEAERDGVSPLIGASYHHFPLLEQRGIPTRRKDDDPVERLSDVYQWVLANSGPLLAQTVSTLAHAQAQSASNASVFHCSAGKDRTGIISALVLGTLGVTSSVVMADYLLTNQVIEGILQRIKGMEPNSTTTLAMLEAQPVAMERFLTALDSGYGGAEAYLRLNGVTEATIEGLKTGLLT